MTTEPAAQAEPLSHGGNPLLGPDGEGHPQRTQILFTMCLSLVLIVATVSPLNVAIPTIVQELERTDFAG